MAGESISVIIPVLNEAPALPELIAEVERTLSSLTPRYEILIVDDGSKDDTATVLRELAVQYPHLHVVRFRRNYGKAAALSEGFTRASVDYLIAMDGNLQDPPDETLVFSNNSIALTSCADGNSTGRTPGAAFSVRAYVTLSPAC